MRHPRSRLLALLLPVVVLLGACAGLPYRAPVRAGPGAPLLLAVLIDQSGQLAAEVASIRGAAELVVATHGPVAGHPVSLLVEDGGCDAGRTEEVLAGVSSDARLVGVVGPVCAPACVAAIGALDQLAIPFISPRCTDIAMTRQGSAVPFRTAWTDAYEAVAAIQFGRKTLGSRRAFLVNDGTTHGRNLRDVFKLFAGKDNLAGNEEALTGSDDYGPVARAIRKSSARYVYYAGFAEDAPRFIARVREEGITLPVILPESAVDVPALAALPGTGDIYATRAVPDAGESNRKDEFREAYRQRYGTDPGPWAAEAADAVETLLRAVEKSAHTDGGMLTVDRRDLISVIFGTDFRGASGRIRFRANGDRVGGARVDVLQLSGGALARVTSIDPEDEGRRREQGGRP